MTGDTETACRAWTLSPNYECSINFGASAMNQQIPIPSDKKCPLLLAVALLSCSCSLLADGSARMAERYEQAVNFTPARIGELTHELVGNPIWSADGQCVSFSADGPDGVRSYSVSLSDGKRTPVAQPREPAQTERAGIGAASPDGRWLLRREGCDLILEETATRQARRLTHDGGQHFRYGAQPDTVRRTYVPLAEKDSAECIWAPDSARFATYRADERKVRELPHMQSVIQGSAHSVPILQPLRMSFPGDAEITSGELFVGDAASGTLTKVEIPPFSMADWNTPLTWLRWGADGKKFYVVREARGFKERSLHEVDAATGKARSLFLEKSALPMRPHVGTVLAIDLFWLSEKREAFIYHSRESGWGHLYLHDLVTGMRKGPITSGEYNVQSVLRVDEESGLVYFTANGREPALDPYYTQLYRVPLAGGEPQRLTPEPAEHIVQFSPDGRTFVDTHSTPGTAPVTVLRAADGKSIATLFTADLAPLKAAGWRPPHRFRALAADGKTPIYGTLFLPGSMRDGERLPVVDAIYAGSHRASAPRKFGEDKNYMQSTAALGFAVVVVDARGTSLRSQAFQDFSFGAGFGSPEIVADHIAAIRQLAEEFPQMDLTRVGVYGDSWGGYRTARALLQFPDFFSVGVAGAGSHDNYLYNHEHERWFGMPGDADQPYEAQSNLPLAKNLRGRLLLAHGDLDGNVHVANTLQLARAFMDVGKVFDLLILPNVQHDVGDDGYFVRRRWDYLVTHLRGETPPPFQPAPTSR